MVVGLMIVVPNASEAAILPCVAIEPVDAHVPVPILPPHVVSEASFMAESPLFKQPNHRRVVSYTSANKARTG